MIKNIKFTIVVLFVTAMGFAQVGIGTTTPDASSALDVTATNKGFLMPRLTTAQRTAISSPATGLQVYDTDTDTFWYYNGATWTENLGGGKFVDGATSDIAYYDGKVGIGINNTSHKLHVNSASTLSTTNTAARVDATYSGTGTSSATYGVASYVTNSSTGTVSYAIGTQGIINNQNSGGTISSAVGSWPQVNNNGTMSFGGGVFTSVNNYGTMTDIEGFGTYLYNDTGKTISNMFLTYLGGENAGTISKNYGLYLEYFNSGTVTDSYAIYIRDNFNVGTNDNFAIYSASNANSYFEGNIGVGISNPEQKVHINGVMRLQPQTTAPTGAKGDLYAGDDGNLYFHDGTSWRQVQLN
jgi:hypothetical protein